MARGKFSKIAIFSWVCIITIMCSCGLLNITSNEGNIIAIDDSYVPVDSWRVSSPEAQGMDSTKLDEVDEILSKLDIKYIDSITVIRNGFLVYDRFFEFYNYSDLHLLNSVTKSVSSILIGIANKSGFISNLDEPVLEILSDKTFANMDARKEAITIRNLLTMQSGLQWNPAGMFTEFPVHPQDYIFHSNYTNYFNESWPLSMEDDTAKMSVTDDWVQYVLDKPMAADPGTIFQYNTGVSHLLQVIIANKTGMNPQTFAEDYLFSPLNITEYYWWNGLWLHPHDVAKLGYLYLHNGSWGGQAIVLEDYVSQSLIPYGDTGAEDYGFQWWINTQEGYFRGVGIGGQMLLVQPENNLIVVITSSNYLGGWPDHTLQSTLITTKIIPAIIADTSITKNPGTTTTSTAITTTTSTTTTTTTATTTATTPSWTFIFIILCLVVLSSRKYLKFKNKK
ncbi:MAG: serine hydrolase domain-containing protein [Candidatus Hodarchaeales archaeon]